MKLEVNGSEIYAATGGKSFAAKLPSVVFVHGSGLDHRSWALQTRWFAFNGYSVLAPDLPGHSLSDGDALTTIQDMGRWLIDLLDSAQVQRAHLVGHSQGFLCALEAASQDPERILSLSGVATAAAIPVNPVLIETAQQSALDAADLMLRWGFGQDMQMGVSPVPGMQPIAIGRRIMAGNPLAVDLQACADYTAGADVARSLRLSSLLVLAGKDRMTPLASGRQLGEWLDAEVQVIEGYGHMLPIEAPKQTLQALSHFIGKHNKN